MSHWPYGLGFPAPQAQAVGLQSNFFATSFIDQVAYSGLVGVDHYSGNVPVGGVSSSDARNENNEIKKLMELSSAQETKIRKLNAKVDALEGLKAGQDYILQRMQEQIGQLEAQVMELRDDALTYRMRMNDLMREAQESSLQSSHSTTPALLTNTFTTDPIPMTRSLSQSHSTCSSSSQVNENDLINSDEKSKSSNASRLVKPGTKKRKTVRSCQCTYVKKNFVCRKDGCTSAYHYLCDLRQHSRRSHKEKDPLKGTFGCPGCAKIFGSRKALSNHKKVCTINLLEPEVVINHEDGDVFPGEPNQSDGEICDEVD